MGVCQMNSTDFTWVIPNTRWFGKRYWNHIPYVEGILTAVLRRENISVSVIDANGSDLSQEELTSQLSDLGPNIVGVSCMSVEYRKSAHACFEITKKEDLGAAAGLSVATAAVAVTKEGEAKAAIEAFAKENKGE